MKRLINNTMKIIATKAPGHQGFIFYKTLCVTLCLCVLVANFLTGNDKIKIICSPLGGYSLLPESDYQISYINPDGSVNWQKLNRMLWEISFTGANMWWEFPPWITSEKEYEILTPFKFENEKMVLNPQYFENLRKIAGLSNQYNLTLIFDLFNGSETRVNPTRYHSPWKKFPGYFYTAPRKYLDKWIDAVLEAHNFTGLSPSYFVIVEKGILYIILRSSVKQSIIKSGDSSSNSFFVWYP